VIFYVCGPIAVGRPMNYLVTPRTDDRPTYCFTFPAKAVELYSVHYTVCKRVKFSHTRYRVFGPELIPLYRHSVRRWL